MVADLEVVAGKGARHAHAFQHDVGAVRHSLPAGALRCMSESYVAPSRAVGHAQHKLWVRTTDRDHRCDCTEPWADMILNVESSTWPLLPKAAGWWPVHAKLMCTLPKLAITHT